MPVLHTAAADNKQDDIMSKAKFLVLYPNPDNVDAVIAKANVQNTKNGPFAAVLLLGAALPATPPSTIPDAPTYFLGAGSLPATIDVAHNYTCVQSPTCVFKLESGFTVAFVDDSRCAAPTLDLPPETEVDLLCSVDWPREIAAHERLTLVGSDTVSAAARALHPRYHFAVGNEPGRFLEFPMFKWSSTRTCRFVSLAREQQGSRWFYAFGLGVADDTSLAGENPYETREISKRPFEETGPEGIKLARTESPLPRLESSGVPQPPAPRVVAPSECYFCLSNPQVQTHMIVAIGQHSYVTVAKGPLPLPARDLKFSGHAIIIPIQHKSTLPDDEATREEVHRFMDTLAGAFLAAKYDTVFYEVSRDLNVHSHIQMVPVRKNADFGGALSVCEARNLKFDRSQNLQFGKYTEEDEKRAAVLATRNYIQFTLVSGSLKTFFLALLDDKPVDLQFPRRVLAHLMKLPKRVKWDRCQQSVGEEKREVLRFKAFYEKYDFTK